MQAAAAFTGLVNGTTSSNATEEADASLPAREEDGGKTAQDAAASTNALALGACP